MLAATAAAAKAARDGVAPGGVCAAPPANANKNASVPLSLMPMSVDAVSTGAENKAKKVKHMDMEMNSDKAGRCTSKSVQPMLKAQRLVTALQTKIRSNCCEGWLSISTLHRYNKMGGAGRQYQNPC